MSDNYSEAARQAANHSKATAQNSAPKNLLQELEQRRDSLSSEAHIYENMARDRYEQVADLDRAIAALSVPEVAEVEIPEGFVKWEGAGCVSEADWGKPVTLLYADGTRFDTLLGVLPSSTSRLEAYRIIPTPSEPTAEAKGEDVLAEFMKREGAVKWGDESWRDPPVGSVVEYFSGDEVLRHIVGEDDLPEEIPVIEAGRVVHEASLPKLVASDPSNLQFEWTRYSSIMPEAPAEYHGHTLQSRYSAEHGEWVFRYVPHGQPEPVLPIEPAAEAKGEEAVPCPVTFDADTPEDERNAIAEGWRAAVCGVGRDDSHMRDDLKRAWLFGYDAAEDPTGIRAEWDAPDTITIAASEQHAEESDRAKYDKALRDADNATDAEIDAACRALAEKESARAQEAEADFWAKHLVKA